MSNRLVIALALSGALHASVFIAAAELHTRLMAGFEHPPGTETLSVSIRSPSTAPESRERPARSSPSKPHQPATPDSGSLPPRQLANRVVVRHATDRTSAKRQEQPARRQDTAPPGKPETNLAETRPEQGQGRDAARTSSLPESRPGNQGQAAAAAPAHGGSSAPNSHGDDGQSAEHTYLAEFLAALSRHKYYPRSARLRRQQGRVVVALVLKNDGTINDVKIKEPSQYPLLNRAALRSVRQLDRFKPFPTSMHRSAWRLSVPFQYAIRDP